MKNKLAKVISWRVISILITLFLLYAITGNIKASTGVTVLLHCFLTVAHFIFETLWENKWVSK
tara:strand:- start:1079 stop:1267 length:189 start_codon:yes stop_codon:yes gene_type:complete